MTSRVNELSSLVKSLFSRMVSSLELQAPSRPTPRPGTMAIPLPFNLVINQTGVSAVGIGAAALPRRRCLPGARLPEADAVHRAMLPWTTIYAAGDACSSTLPEAGPRDHQVVVIRRGGCSFTIKLGNIPAYLPSPKSLQLIVMVSDEEDDRGDYRAHAMSGIKRWHGSPAARRDTMTPAGIPRRHPIPLIMVGGGDSAYHQLSVAERIGLTRRYYIESQGIRSAESHR